MGLRGPVVFMNRKYGCRRFSQESKYKIKGSKSRSIHEKNVIYRNFKNAILKGISWKNGKKKHPQNSTKSERPNGRTADEKKWQKIDDFKGLF